MMQRKKYFIALIIFFIQAGCCLMAAYGFTINGHAELSTGLVPRGAVVNAYEVDPAPGGIYDVSPSPIGTGTVNENGNFTLSFAWPQAGTGFEAGNPDIIFTITQTIDSINQTLLQETSSSIRWNMADASSLNFTIDSPYAVGVPSGTTIPAVPNNKLFLFTRVGSCETANIDCKGSLGTSQGYYRPRKAPFSFTGNNTDMPFGRTLDLFGWIGSQSNIAYYKVRFSTDNGATWNDINTALPNYWYDTTNANPLYWHWVSESMGPVSSGGQDNLYKIPYFVRPNTPWAWYDRIARFNSLLTSDGINRIKFTGYKLSGSTLIEATSTDLLIDPNYGEIVLRIDNSAPQVQIISIKLNNTNIDPCQIITFQNPADKITIQFRVFDQKGHLMSYALNALFGHNQSVSPAPSTPNKAIDGYNANAGASPVWTGNLGYVTEYNASIYTSALMPTCAYQFRLSVTKRTTNGYGLIYDYVADTWHITIQR